MITFTYAHASHCSRLFPDDFDSFFAPLELLIRWRLGWRLGSTFVLSTGDNFYEDGVESTRDAHRGRSASKASTTHCCRVRPGTRHLERRDVHYVVSAAGAECRATGANADTCFSRAALDFVALTLTPDTPHVRFCDEDARVLHRTRWERPEENDSVLSGLPNWAPVNAPRAWSGPGGSAFHGTPRSAASC